MSNYHVLGGSEDGNSFTIVFHIPIPSTNNRAGVNYRTALVQSLGGSQTSAVPGLDAGEQTQLNNGELFEVEGRVSTHPGETLVQLRNRMDALFSARQTVVQQQLQSRLAYWGFSRNVP